MAARLNATDRRHAGAAIEFAIILPLLAILILGCIDLGRFAYSYIAITNAARAGAGFAIVHPPPSDAGDLERWRERVQDAAGYEMTRFDKTLFSDFNARTAVEVTLEPSATPPDWNVTVDVPYTFRTVVPYPWFPPGPSGGSGSSVTMHRTVVMRGIRDN